MTEYSEELANLNQYYLGDAVRLIQERFRPQETLTWATNCGYSGYGFGYVLLSSERVFSVRFRAGVSHGYTGAMAAIITHEEKEKRRYEQDDDRRKKD